MFKRIWDAILLKSSLYQKVAADNGYTLEATIIVVSISLLSSSNSLVNTSHPLTISFVAQVANSIIFAWLIWSFIAYKVGMLLGGHGEMGGMLRSMGYASSPRLLAFFGFVPCISIFAILAAWLLSICAAFIAIRETMGLSNKKAILVCILGLLIYALTSWIIGSLLGGNAEMAHLLNG
jgi:hypothetical protein